MCNTQEKTQKGYKAYLFLGHPTYFQTFMEAMQHIAKKQTNVYHFEFIMQNLCLT